MAFSLRSESKKTVRIRGYNIMPWFVSEWEEETKSLSKNEVTAPVAYLRGIDSSPQETKWSIKNIIFMRYKNKYKRILFNFLLRGNGSWRRLRQSHRSEDLQERLDRYSTQKILVYFAIYWLLFILLNETL